MCRKLYFCCNIVGIAALVTLVLSLKGIMSPILPFVLGLITVAYLTLLEVIYPPVKGVTVIDWPNNVRRVRTITFHQRASLRRVTPMEHPWVPKEVNLGSVGGPPLRMYDRSLPPEPNYALDFVRRHDEMARYEPLREQEFVQVEGQGILPHQASIYLDPGRACWLVVEDSHAVSLDQKPSKFGTSGRNLLAYPLTTRQKVRLGPEVELQFH